MRWLLIADVILMWIIIAGIRTAVSTRNPTSANVVGALIIFFIVLNVGLILWRWRRSIVTKADTATVATLATGLKASRKIAEHGKRYRDRIVDRANKG